MASAYVILSMNLVQHPNKTQFNLKQYNHVIKLDNSVLISTSVYVRKYGVCCDLVILLLKNSKGMVGLKEFLNTFFIIRCKLIALELYQ